ncbi:MAG: MucR family transcriptional regulator [Candidatus Tectomicrobia bacterium]|nr:MucR family transcriptional regulator [Candidatus Tectomicrobia bacterium]
MSTKSLIELSARIIAAQALRKTMTPADIDSELRAVFQTLRELDHVEQQTQPSQSKAAPTHTLDYLRQHPHASVQPHQVICLECGKAYSLLPHRHLVAHDLTPTTYKQKWGLPRATPLSAHSLTHRRRRLAKTLGTGQQLIAWQAQHRQPMLKPVASPES